MNSEIINKHKDSIFLEKYKKQDIELVLDIWLQASFEAHSFIPKEFWESKIEDMRNIYIPNSETWVCKKNEKIIGFFSLYENTLAAIFIYPHEQGKGIGKRLMQKAKLLRKSLNLTVYSENISSIEFYKNQDFVIKKEQVDSNTKRNELFMEWNIKQ